MPTQMREDESMQGTPQIQIGRGERKKTLVGTNLLNTFVAPMGTPIPEENPVLEEEQRSEISSVKSVLD